MANSGGNGNFKLPQAREEWKLQKLTKKRSFPYFQNLKQ